jgi:putative endonuclease
MGSVETHKTGLFAETLAVIFLRLRGWRILSRRFKTNVGEIDIIAKRGKQIAFIEVKRRRTIDDALMCLSPNAITRIRRAAEWFLKSRPEFADKCDMRFDLIAIAPYARIRHIPNAF